MQNALAMESVSYTHLQADFVPAGTFGSRNETLLGRKRPVEPGLRLRGIFRAVQAAQQQQ